jgi:hypothetical protein
MCGIELDPEVADDERTYGPSNPGRQSWIGVASFNAVSKSEITWGVAARR